MHILLSKETLLYNKNHLTGQVNLTVNNIFNESNSRNETNKRKISSTWWLKLLIHSRARWRSCCPNAFRSIPCRYRNACDNRFFIGVYSKMLLNVDGTRNEWNTSIQILGFQFKISNANRNLQTIKTEFDANPLPHTTQINGFVTTPAWRSECRLRLCLNRKVLSHCVQLNRQFECDTRRCVVNERQVLNLWMEKMRKKSESCHKVTYLPRTTCFALVSTFIRMHALHMLH